MMAAIRQHRGAEWLIAWTLAVLVPFISDLCVSEHCDDGDDCET
jgi:hypothetical protein